MINRINFISPRKISFPINVLLFNSCRLWPFRNKYLWIFGAREGTKYDDNSMYMFEYVNRMYKNKVRAVWMTNNLTAIEKVRSLGFEAYHNSTWRGKWLQLRAGVVLYSHGLIDFGIFPFVGGACCVALWHGMGFKKIYNGKYTGKLLFIKKFLDNLFSWTYRNITIVTSKYAAKWAEEMFTLNPKEIYITGQPRNDAFRFISKRKILQELGIQINKKVLIYMPTYRSAVLGVDAMENIVLDLYNSNELNTVLTKNDYVFIAKLHPLTPHINVQNRENFIILDYDMVEDNQQLMGISDMLITDFSSCFVDYALLKRPIIFYEPDEELFLNKSEKMDDLFFQIETMNKATTCAELADKIAHPSLAAVDMTNEIFEDDSIKNSSYCQNVYDVLALKILS